MKLTPWAELERRFLTPSQARRAAAEARRGILVEFHRFHEDASWVVFVHGPRGTNVHAHGETIAGARRRVRAELVAVAGTTRSAALWRARAETMPAGAEELEQARRRRRRTGRHH